jgi:hypothetical protein
MYSEYDKKSAGLQKYLPSLPGGIKNSTIIPDRFEKPI